MTRALAVMTLMLAAGPAAAVEERDPTLRVVVRLAQGARPETASAVHDLEEALGRLKPPAAIGPASGGAPADLHLWLTNRILRTPSATDRTGQSPTITLDGLLVAGRQSLPCGGAGVSPRKAAEALVAQAESHARQHLLLRARPDWRDPGFEFEPLTKERRKELGVKEGAAVVTAVRPGPAQEAGLAAGDVVVRADGQKLGDAADLASALYRAVPGTRVDLALVRGPERLTATLTVR